MRKYIVLFFSLIEAALPVMGRAVFLSKLRAVFSYELQAVLSDELRATSYE